MVIVLKRLTYGSLRRGHPAGGPGTRSHSSEMRQYDPPMAERHLRESRRWDVERATEFESGFSRSGNQDTIAQLITSSPKGFPDACSCVCVRRRCGLRSG